MLVVMRLSNLSIRINSIGRFFRICPSLKMFRNLMVHLQGSVWAASIAVVVVLVVESPGVLPEKRLAHSKFHR